MTSKIAALKTISQTSEAHTGSVLFFHGSGDTGKGFLEWIKFLIGDFTHPNLKYLFPTAPLQPYTPMNGESSNVWFDRYDISPKALEHTESMESMGEEVKRVIDREVAAGVALKRIVVGGFSMGGALALHTGYRFYPGLAGVFALSSFLNHNSAVYEKLEHTDASEDLPPLFMCHGDRDLLVPLAWGKDTYDKLSELKVKGEFTVLKNTMHELKKSELNNLFQWIHQILPNENV